MDYFCHSSTGQLAYDIDEYGRYWAFLLCDKAIVNYYNHLCLNYGIKLIKGSSRGAHVTWVRGEKPEDLTNWGKEGEVEFRYTNVVRFDNGRHAWLDVNCPILHELRNALSLPRKDKMSFHLTVGREWDR